MVTDRRTGKERAAGPETGPGEDTAASLQEGRAPSPGAAGDDDPFAAFTEWETEADQRNYAGL